MRNTKLVLAMLAGCTVLSGAAFAQDAQSAPTSSSTSQQTQTTDAGKKGSENGSMTSTHKKGAHHKAKKDASGSSEPAKSSSSGM